MFTRWPYCHSIETVKTYIFIAMKLISASGVVDGGTHIKLLPIPVLISESKISSRHIFVYGEKKRGKNCTKNTLFEFFGLHLELFWTCNAHSNPTSRYIYIKNLFTSLFLAYSKILCGPL